MPTTGRWSPRICVGLAVLPLVVACAEPDLSDRVSPVAGDDPKMNAAIAEARAKLPEFWAKYEKPAANERDFSVKLKIDDRHGTEYFWLIDLERKGGKITGLVANEPETVKRVHLGDRVDVPEADIADWLYLRDGKMVGNYTLRVLYDRMSPSEAAKVKAMLADP